MEPPSTGGMPASKQASLQDMARQTDLKRRQDALEMQRARLQLAKQEQEIARPELLKLLAEHCVGLVE